MEVQAVEARYRDDLASLEGLAEEIYVEISLDDALESRLDALAARRLRAKVRCGGESTPSIRELARFVRACRTRGVVFKATAGLHHAVRRDAEHGFLNLLAAVVFGDEEAALADEDAGSFALDAESFRWRDRTADAAELSAARRSRFRSIGSCSFFEPVEELEALGVQPA
jgi:predicted transcriptional regulator